MSFQGALMLKTLIAARMLTNKFLHAIMKSFDMHLQIIMSSVSLIAIFKGALQILLLAFTLKSLRSRVMFFGNMQVQLSFRVINFTAERVIALVFIQRLFLGMVLAHMFADLVLLIEALPAAFAFIDAFRIFQ